MGSLLARLGVTRESGRADMDAIATQIPQRGRQYQAIAPGLVVGVQARAFGEDAWVIERRGWIVALHGYLVPRSLSNASEPGSVDNPSEIYDVLIRKLNTEGPRCLLGLEGEFALLAVQLNTQTVFVLRSSPNGRPLYFSQLPDGIVIATDRVALESVLPDGRSGINTEELASRLVFGRSVFSSEATVLTKVSRFEGGALYRLPADKKWAPIREGEINWEVFNARAIYTNANQAVEKLDTLLDQAVDEGLAWRPGVLALSGGLDSSSLWARIQKKGRSGDPRQALVGAGSMVFPGWACDETSEIIDNLEFSGARGWQLDMSLVKPSSFVSELLSQLPTVITPSLYQLVPFATEVAKRGASIMYMGIGPDDWLDIPRWSFRRSGLANAIRPWARGVRSKAASKFGVRPDSQVAGASAWHGEVCPNIVQRGIAELSSIHAEFGEVTAHKIRALRRFNRRELDLLEPLAERRGVEIRNPMNTRDFVRFSFSLPRRVARLGGLYKGLLRRTMSLELPQSVLGRNAPIHFGPVSNDPELVLHLGPAGSWRLVEQLVCDREWLDRQITDVRSSTQVGAQLFKLAWAEWFFRSRQ